MFLSTQEDAVKKSNYYLRRQQYVPQTEGFAKLNEDTTTNRDGCDLILVRVQQVA